MPSRRAVRGHPTRCNVEEQRVPNAPEVPHQGKVTNDEFWEAIRILSQAMTNQIGKQRRSRQEVVDILRNQEFLRINPPSFTS